MGKKKSKNQGENQQQQQQQEKKNEGGGGGGGDGGKKDDGVISVVLKVDMHCEGCATKIKKSVKGIEGVESVRGGIDSNKLTVIGNVDPVELREMVEQKMKKKVELVSPLPKKDKDSKKDKDNNKDKEKDGGGGGGGEKKAEEKPEKKPEGKKSKEPPVSTAVLKLNLHCQGCIQKIRKTVTKTKGYHEMSIDEQKNQVTVKGAMDMKALAETLAERLKKSVEIVPPKKEGGEKKEKGGGDGGGGEKGKGGGGGKKLKGGGGGEQGQTEGESGGGGNGGVSAEENRIQFVQHVYPNPPFMYGYGMGYPMEYYYQYHNVHAPQIFSDENPNACSVM